MVRKRKRKADEEEEEEEEEETEEKEKEILLKNSSFSNLQLIVRRRTKPAVGYTVLL